MNGGGVRGISADILVGATASGKSAVAQLLAAKSRPPRPLLAADSMTVYRGMDVGTAKPDAADRALVPYEGLDLADPGCEFSVGDYLAAVRARAEALAAGPSPIVVGGTGLYVKCLTEGLDSAPPSSPGHRAAAEALLAAEGLEALQDALRRLSPEQYARVRDPENPRRVVRAYELVAGGHEIPVATERPRPFVVGLVREPEDLAARIARRARRMFADGLVEEVRALRARPGGLSETARHAIGYEEAGRLLDGEIGEEEAIQLTILRTRRYAKRQMTWFRHQANVDWVEVAPDDSPEKIAGRVQRLWNRHGPVALRP
jgi:tRNA dimethylallyltransferase